VSLFAGRSTMTAVKFTRLPFAMPMPTSFAVPNEKLVRVTFSE